MNTEELLNQIEIKHPNRINKRKNKQGSGCKMCKPWKGKWESRFTKKEKQRMRIELPVEV